MNNLKKGLVGFGFIVILGAILGQGLTYQHYLMEEAARTFNSSSFEAFYVIFPIVIGVYLALPEIIRQKFSPGSWKVDWIKLLSIGLPCLYFAVIPMAVGHPSLNWLPFRFTPIAFHDVFNKLAGIVLGYALITSFYKDGTVSITSYANKEDING